MKPALFAEDDWQAWNAGYNVLLRVEVLLNEVSPGIGQVLSGAARKGQQGGGKRWIYFTWGTDKQAA